MIHTDLRKRAITGLGWSGISQALDYAFTPAILVVLARLLGPRVYALIGMVNVFTRSAGICADFGLRKDIQGAKP